MKILSICIALLSFMNTRAQTEKAENIFIITTDGFRWQEVFNGADSLLINNPRFVTDTALAKQMYWDPLPAERRKKLLPFFWNILAKQGQLYGNRMKESRVDVKNMYKISYPGYNEMLTGYADPLPILNAPQYNHNTSVLEYLNGLPAYNGKVAAFTSWNVFPFILNNKRNTIQQNSGYQALQNDDCESTQVCNAVQDSVQNKYKTRYDALTFFAAKEHIKNHHPRVLFIGLGETDEYAHQEKYDLYLQHATAFDRMLAELWYLVQTDPVYKNKTAFIISTDHGRGKYKDKWTSHHTLIRGSGEIWLGMIGKGIEPVGEMQEAPALQQNQLAATVGFLLGEKFVSDKKTGKPISLPSTETRVVNQGSAAPLPPPPVTSAEK